MASGEMAGVTGEAGRHCFLNGDALDLGAALDEVERTGACHLPGVLSSPRQEGFQTLLERAAFEPVDQRVRDVYQAFEALAAEPEDALRDELGALAEAFGSVVRAYEEEHDLSWLIDYAPNDIQVQRYRAGCGGITPHRDGKRFVKLIAIFSLGSPVELRVCRDRKGALLRSYRLATGDLVLLRAPGFAGRSEAQRPLHAVAGPSEGVRYSIALRMERTVAL